MNENSKKTSVPNSMKVQPLRIFGENSKVAISTSKNEKEWEKK
jgi:hypothetical protein